MLLILSDRFKKHIAILLLWIFYAQFAFAWRMPVASAAGHVHTWSGAPVVTHGPYGGVFDHAGATGGHKRKSAASAPLQVLAQPDQAAMGGPTQPEMGAFQSVNANNMVDLFSGDFSYNIPLMDVGGYPVNLAYRSGTGMDDDASWVGLGWNINPGSITRTVRGLPDDFDGGNDTVRKVNHIKTNKSWGVNVGGDIEFAGLPLGLGTGGGIFHNTYNGWGTEFSINASLNSGDKSFGNMSGGLSLTDNSQQGVTLTPSLSANFSSQEARDQGGTAIGTSISASYSARTGIKTMQLGLSDPQANSDAKNLWNNFNWNTSISFSGPTYTPTISIPTTNRNTSFTAKLGLEYETVHPSVYVSGYTGEESVADADTALYLPAFGYLNYQDAGGNYAALTDFNREKEIPYREKPAIPHIAVPAYTYDAFCINGEGTGGMFRAYRGDIGFVADPLMSNKSASAAYSVDLGIPDLVHGGVDINQNYSHTTSGPWLDENGLRNTIAFQKNNGLFEAAYFRNPGEKTINTTDFYNAIGGDDVVAPVLAQSGPSIVASNTLTRYSGQKVTGTVTLTPSTATRNTRDKRTEVISYLTASQASQVGLDKYIYHYALNQFALRNCENDAPNPFSGLGSGLQGSYFRKTEALAGAPTHVRTDTTVYFNWSSGNSSGNPFNTFGSTLFGASKTDPGFGSTDFSVRWDGYLKPPTSGTYTIGTVSDDGVRLWLNDTLVIDQWSIHNIHSYGVVAKGDTIKGFDTIHVNLRGGEFYKLRMEYFQDGGADVCYLVWRTPGDLTPIDQDHGHRVPTAALYQPNPPDTVPYNPVITEENRVNNFRQPNHISEIDVLNPDGRKYVYGIPVYNLSQKEVSFAVNADSGTLKTGLTAYQDTVDNTTRNNNGKDGYFSKTETPAYAHSFLLTGILSPDYVDVTGDGISDDDIGDAVKFNYTKVAGIANPFGWRAPYITDSANYSEGFRSYDRDDRAHYVYGTKELWYLNSVESKTMIATFTLQPRSDLVGVDERGHKSDNTKSFCLKQIDLYSKADFMAHGPALATPIKTVHFQYSYQLCRGINQPVNDSGKLTLTKIWFTYNGNDKGIRNPYVFYYHPNNPRYKVNTVDKWGTYKDASMNPGWTAANPITNEEYPYAIQDSTQAAYNVGAWEMDSIVLPSAGKIKVNYESDDYAYVQNRRSTLMCKIAGFGKDRFGSYGSSMYVNGGPGASYDNLYAYITVPYAPASQQDLYARYLAGISKLYFKIFVQMPTDTWGSGDDYVPGYADLDTASGNWYGTVSGQPNVIWVKIKGVNKTGDGDGSFNPMVETAINLLRLNLPSKAYPGSEVSDTLSIQAGIAIMTSMASNISQLLQGFDGYARGNGWVNRIDPNRSYIRLDDPTLNKKGGGLRVKSILIYDNWNAMTQKRETVYGQVYDYTTTQNIAGVPTVVSSGVATWEPAVGAEENPFRLPIEYVDRASMLAPAAALYTEEPLCEALYPSASVGYSRVRVRSIHGPEVKSANGYTENTFYTSYDFPVSWDYSMLDNSTKKRYKPLLSEFLHVNAQNFLTFSQGFKVELNDMNGKAKSTAVYAQTDTNSLISYTENFYRVDDPNAQAKHLSNTVATIDPFGNIDTASTVGKDAELMADMREQSSESIGNNTQINVDVTLIGEFPVPIPSFFRFPQKETDRFRSVAMTKVIQRYGILDSVVHIDKGSKISTKNVLYDSETGDPLLTRTQNEFNDPVYNFTYPAHWVYDGTGSASQNIGAVLQGLTIQAGKITMGLPSPDSTFLTPGDEILAYSHSVIAPGVIATFPDAFKLWVIDANSMRPAAQDLRLVDQYGTPFAGNNATLLVTRSGRRNTNSAVGSITSLSNPLARDGSGVYHLILDSTIGVVAAAANELQQVWSVEDKRRMASQTTCVYSLPDSTSIVAEGCACLRPFFDYLIASHQLFFYKTQHRTVRSLVDAALTAGYAVDTTHCPILTSNLDQLFYTQTSPLFNLLNPNQHPTQYLAWMGMAQVKLASVSGEQMNPYNLVSTGCDPQGHVLYKDPTISVPKLDTITVRYHPNFSTNIKSELGACPFYLDTLLTIDSTSDHLMLENNLEVYSAIQNAVSLLRFDSLGYVPDGSTLLSAKLILQADTRGHIPTLYDSANSTNPMDTVGCSVTGYTGWYPYMNLDTLLYQGYNSPWAAMHANKTPFQNDTVDVSKYLTNFYYSTPAPSYYSSTFLLAQGSGLLWAGPGSDTMPTVPASGGVPPYFLSGYTNYYSTYYNQHYADSSKWPVLQITYVRPQAPLDTFGAMLSYSAMQSCNTIVTRSCFSSVTDTLINAYQFGVLGNFRPLTNYVYYNQRKETVADSTSNIRTYGTIPGFHPFWTLQSGNWTPSYDSSRWVWNTQTTLYNRKGFELENRDPLGRFNSGLYGYGLTLPTAVTQNSRYQEMMFEGFEDYGFIANTCDTVCPEPRSFDFSLSGGTMVTTTAHTGLYSFQVGAGQTASVTAPVSAASSLALPQLTDSVSGGTFEGQKANPATILPNFSPYAGKRMWISAWVKEGAVCTCQQYTGDHVQLSFTVGGVTSGTPLSPKGNIIEGWQRYDTLIIIPANATGLTLTLSASPTSITYFDDIRIQPFNAEMKSYVYNPTNLRLMAELDENNYATFYEYDNDGTLSRVKKETERGILTIKETRSSLVKPH